jgi:hypothetical protein
MKQFTTACREKLTHGTPVGKAIIDYRKVMFSCTLLDMYLIKPKKTLFMEIVPRQTGFV